MLERTAMTPDGLAGDVMRRWLTLAPVGLLLAAAAEIAVFVWVAHLIGGGWAGLLLVVSCLSGLALLRREGVRGWRRFRAAADAGQPPGPQVTDGLVGLLGALLLAVPGFLTALVGSALLVPPLRGVARRGVEHATERRVPAAVVGDLFGPRRVRVRRGAPVPTEPPPDRSTGPAIEGEVVEGEVVDAGPTREP
jgi:UPF0716 protein FxsA